MPYNSRWLYKSFSHTPLASSRGFTLIELIVGIVVLAIALSIISTLIAPTEQKSADQVLQVKAAELGQSLLNDISSRAFDENSDMAGGRIRCDEISLGAKPCSTILGPETGEVNRGSFNDVDDFNGYKEKFNANDENLADGYRNFIIEVAVEYDGESLGLVDNLGAPNDRGAKKITVSVTTPLGTEIVFATHKANF